MLESDDGVVDGVVEGVVDGVDWSSPPMFGQSPFAWFVPVSLATTAGVDDGLAAELDVPVAA